MKGNPQAGEAEFFRRGVGAALSQRGLGSVDAVVSWSLASKPRWRTEGGAAVADTRPCSLVRARLRVLPGGTLEVTLGRPWGEESTFTRRIKA